MIGTNIHWNSSEINNDYWENYLKKKHLNILSNNKAICIILNVKVILLKISFSLRKYFEWHSSLIKLVCKITFDHRFTFIII